MPKKKTPAKKKVAAKKKTAPKKKKTPAKKKPTLYDALQEPIKEVTPAGAIGLVSLKTSSIMQPNGMDAWHVHGKIHSLTSYTGFLVGNPPENFVEIPMDNIAGLQGMQKPPHDSEGRIPADVLVLKS